MDIANTLRGWMGGVRFYIALAIGLFTIESIWWAEVTHGGTLLFATRLVELYAWVAIGLLAAAVSIGPICSVWPGIPAKQALYDARRLLGIGAAWFSTLHVFISYGSLFKFANPLSLPGNYQRAFAIGAIGSIILLAMAFTSFDRAVRGMGRWWFRLHRFVYLAVIVSLLHAFLIGAHASMQPALLILTALVALIVGLHVYLTFIRHRPRSMWQAVTVPVVAILLVSTLILGYSR